MTMTMQLELRPPFIRWEQALCLFALPRVPRKPDSMMEGCRIIIIALTAIHGSKTKSTGGRDEDASVGAALKLETTDT